MMKGKLPNARRERDFKILPGIIYPHQDIAAKTQTIYKRIISHSRVIESGNFTCLSTEDLRRMFEMYDSHFFNGVFKKNLAGKISFRLSKRMTSAGGKTVYSKNTGAFQIVISSTLIFQSFEDVKRDVVVNGIICRDRLEAMMRIFEHEMIHLTECVLFGKSSCTEPRFKQLSKNIFGHSNVVHQLVTFRERAEKVFNLRLGDRVMFSVEGKTYIGILNRITKRATVFVEFPQGVFRDHNGKRYSKYLVPLHLLKPVKPD